MESRPLRTGIATDICSKITGFDMGVRTTHGTYIGNPATKERAYTPPQGRDVILGHMSKWEHFLHRDDSLDPLIKLALLHYQFEATHPFSDGNGRTGRILNVLYLVHEKLLKHPVTYLSGYIVQHKSEYYRRLNNVTQNGEWVEWILFILKAVEATSNWTTQLTSRVQALLEETVEVLYGTSIPARDRAYMFFEKPYARHRDFEYALGVSRPTAAKYANQLVNLGLLEKQAAGRNVIYMNGRYLDLIIGTEAPN